MSRNAAVSRVGSEQALAVYQELRCHPETTFDEVADRLELSADERDRCRGELSSLGLTEPRPHAPPGSSAGAPPGVEASVTTGCDQPVLGDGSPGADAAGGTGGTGAYTVVEPDVALLRLLRRERDRLQDRLAAASRAHTALETLAGPFLRAGAAPCSEVEVEIVTDPQRVLRELTELTASVRDAVHVMHTGSVRREDMAAELERDRSRAARGVRVRAMYSRRVGTVPEMTQHLEERAALGVELRLSPVVPMNMVLADENFALLPTDPHDPRSPAILARGPGLVRSYLALYEYCWQAASRYGEEPGETGGDGLSGQQRAALQMLASGIKDEQIARSLGVSLRTVSRLLSEVMQELGAASRFEAGVKAARLGLLDGEGSEQGA